MKKILQELTVPKLRAAQKRFVRSNRAENNRSKNKRKSKKGGASKFNQLPIIDAPSKLDLYSPKNHRVFVSFLKSLRDSVKVHDKVVINLKHSSRITAAAGLLLVAEVDRLKKAFPSKSIKCINPEDSYNGLGKSAQNLVESALNQIGFYRILGQASNKKASASSVKKWRQLSGDSADGTLADSLLQTLKDDIPALVLKKLYRGAIEAIANCVEHAYPSSRIDGLEINDPRWWMLVGLDDATLSIIVCDLGVGIPNTLPSKHEESILNYIKTALGITGNSDSDMIQMSTHIRQTRTKLNNRGKGGKDFRSMTINFPSSVLTVRSNKGAFFITGKERASLKKVSSRRFVSGTDRSESMIEHANSICGTLIEWAIPLKDLR